MKLGHILPNIFTVRVSGVDSDRWHKAKKAKPEAATRLKATNTMTEFEEREAVFEEHRDALTAEFKYVVSHLMYLEERLFLISQVQDWYSQHFQGILER